jgi:hypothetical protein
MIRHVVIWRVRGDTRAERLAHAQRVKSAFEALRGRVPGMQRIELGIDDSGVDYACDVVLLGDFDDTTALAAYASHPEHLRAKAAVAGLRINRHQVDFEVTA